MNVGDGSPVTRLSTVVSHDCSIHSQRGKIQHHRYVSITGPHPCDSLLEFYKFLYTPLTPFYTSAKKLYKHEGLVLQLVKNTTASLTKHALSLLQRVLCSLVCFVLFLFSYNLCFCFCT